MSSPVTETPDLYGAFPRLSEAQLDVLLSQGEVRKLDEGTVLYAAGDVVADFFVVLSGLAATVEDRGIGRSNGARQHKR